MTAIDVAMHVHVMYARQHCTILEQFLISLYEYINSIFSLTFYEILFNY